MRLISKQLANSDRCIQNPRAGLLAWVDLSLEQDENAVDGPQVTSLNKGPLRKMDELVNFTPENILSFGVQDTNGVTV